VFLGLRAGAWVILLQGISTYCAFGSAYLLLKPILRTQVDESHIAALETAEVDDPQASSVFEKVIAILKSRVSQSRPRGIRENLIGYALLLASVLAFTAALGLQIATDVAFRSESSCSSPPCAQQSWGQ